MKIYSSLIVLCLLQVLLCEELGGIKVVINNNFINSALYGFEDKIKQLLQGVKLKDFSVLKNMVLGVDNFSMDKINLFFDDKGLINVNIKNIEPYVNGEVSIKLFFTLQMPFKVTLKNFNLSAKIKLKSKKLSDGEYAPDAEFASDPELNFDIIFETGIKDFNKVLNEVGDFGKNILLPVITPKLNDILGIIFKSLPTETKIGKFWMDFTLASPITLSNKCLELNTYGLIFSKEYPETKNKNRFPLASFPSISSNKFQLFVSEYVINAAAFTYLTANKNENKLKVKLEIDKINALLPDISERYPVEFVDVTVNPKTESAVHLSEDYMLVELPATMNVAVNGNDVFISEVDLKIKFKILIEDTKLTAKILEVAGSLGQISLNRATETPDDVIRSRFNFITMILPTLINMYIEKNVNLSIPTVMGISFTDVEIQHKDSYLLVNLNLSH